jgi:hypothetical protein
VGKMKAKRERKIRRDEARDLKRTRKAAERLARRRSKPPRAS